MNLEELRKGTEIGKEIDSIEELYATIDSDLEAFDSKAGIHCICEHGSCCEHYIPELTPLEAEYLAYIILRDGREEEVVNRLSSFNQDLGICPLYNKDGNYHCSVYSARSLLCRLFGSACFVDKNGHRFFHPCKWNKDTKCFSEEELKNNTIPSMGEYGRALYSLPGNDEDTETIDIALPKAIGKLKLVMSLMDRQ